MQYQSDYVLRLIEQMGMLVRRALASMSIGSIGEAYDLGDEAVGLALEMDPSIVARLSPQSLASMLELNNLDDRVLELVAEALDVQAQALQQDGELVDAALRRDQATAVRALLDPSRAN